MNNIVAYAKALARELLGHDLRVIIGNTPNGNYMAHYTKGIPRLVINMARVGKKWFNDGPTTKVNNLMIHEFGHDYCSDHLSEEYHDALCDLGARMTQLALDKPGFFKGFKMDS